MFEPTWVEAFQYVRAIEDCRMDHAVWVSNAALANVEDPNHKRWDQIQLDLAEQYLRLKCNEEAEHAFSLLIGSTKFPDLEARAKAGLDRALAARAREPA